MNATHPIVQMFKAAAGAAPPLGPALSVGLMAADLMALGADVGRLEAAGARLAHFDVMDGCYVPMLTAGPPFIKAVRTSMLKDVHLMVREPLASVGDYVAAGADIITIHPDACAHPHRVLQVLGAATRGDRAVARGLALNPGMPVDGIDPFLDDIEMVMLVAINPGWGGQAFLPATLGRIEAVRRKIAASGRGILLAVDGGITRRNAGQLAGRGVDIVVTGSAVFDGDVKANIDEMTRALRGSHAEPDRLRQDGG
ncbi:MAG: ribulose-phosphate 3-epimerase, partial [Rhodospirillaceae bacterium]